MYNPDWFESNTLPGAKAQADDFVKLLEDFLGVQRTVINVKKQWTEDDPMGTGKTFEEEFLRVSENDWSGMNVG